MIKLDLTAGSVRERVGSQAHPAQRTERSDTGRWRYPWLSWADARVSSLSPQLYSFCRMSITLPSRPDEIGRISTAPALQKHLPQVRMSQSYRQRSASRAGKLPPL